MKLANKNNTFTIKEAVKSIVYQLRICIQKTNTSLCSISTIPKSSNLSYENILNHYLNADTVPVEDYLDNKGWVTGERSDILIEKAMTKAQVDAGRRYNGTRTNQFPDLFYTRNCQTRYHALNDL